MRSAPSEVPAEIHAWLARDLFEHAPVSIAVIDEDLRIVLANQNFAAVFGDPHDKTCHQAYKNQDEPCSHCALSKTLRDGVARISEEQGVDCIGKHADYVAHHAAIGMGERGASYVVNMSYDVTDRKSFQKQYDLIFQHVPCSLTVIDRDFRIVRANEHAGACYGHAVGSRCYELYKQLHKRCSDCPAQATFADGCTHTSEQIRRTSSGAFTYHMVSTAPLPDGVGQVGNVVEMSVDVTEMHNLSEKLLEESVFRENITESAFDALVATDESGTVTLYNRAAEALFELSGAATIGKERAERFFPEEFRRCISERGDGLELAETTVVNARGEEIPVRFAGAVLRHRGEVIGGAAYFQDIRPVKELERAKLESDRLATVGQTVTQLAHSIKNILTGLQGGIYDINIGMSRELPERTEMGMKSLERNFDRITELVRRFLRFSKDHVTEICACDPNSIAEEIYELYRGTAERLGISLTLRTQPEMGEAELDPRGIHTCLANLVANSIEACEETGMADRAVVLTVSERDGAVVFEVRDTGCGMDDELCAQAFTNIFTTKGGRGTGLGLMMTRKIVEDHGGTIVVNCNSGEGTVMTIAIPRAPSREVRGRARPRQQAARHRSIGRKNQE